MRRPVVLAHPPVSRPRWVCGVLYALVGLLSIVVLAASIVLASVYFRRRS